MKKLFITLLLGCGLISTQAQQLKKGEYYFDTDPGVGNGTSFTFTQADSINMNFNAPTGALPTGFHRVYVRTQNTANVWSHWYDHLFYVKAAPTTPTLTVAPQLKKGEYYFDTDPGVGNATPFTFTQADSISTSIIAPVGSLAPGFHKVYVRTMDVNNVWGLSYENLFYVKDTSALPPLSNTPAVAYMEYFFDDIDYGPGMCAPLNPFTPMDSVLVSGQVIAEDPLFLTPLSVGVHKLNIRAKDLNGVWSMTKSVEFTVCNQAANASFTQSVSGTTVTFTNNSTNSYGTQWIFGDGTTSSDLNPVHTYNNGGILNVGLISYSGCGNDTAWNVINLGCVNPSASFTSSVNNLTATFTNTSTAASSYSWNFGDGRTSTDANPTHVFQASGTYSVCLTTSNGCGSSTVCNNVSVTCTPPVANYNVSINGYTATLTNTSTNAFNFVWNFGDATTNNTDYNPVKQYAAPGNYNLRLTVNNGCGGNFYQTTVTIACAAPTVMFNTYTDGLGVEVENNSLNGTSWAWDFGDGTTSTFKNPPIHNYPATGTYTITLVVTNACGSNTYSQVVNVCTPPVANFVSSPSGTSVNFTNTSTNATSYVWNFGNGLITNLVSPIHNYTSTGNYNVCLTATNQCGNSQLCNNLSLNCNPLPTPEICMVTVDNASINNQIYWNKAGFEMVDSFYVYRDTANNNYAKIGAVAYEDSSAFIDDERTLYAANGDPNVTSWRYKIAYIDTCGNLSAMSPFHQTMFFQNTLGNFSWNPYQIEGQPIPVPQLSNYLFARDDNATGSWNTIQTLSASSTAYTDPNYSTFAATADWRSETQWSISCDPTARLSGNNEINTVIVKSKSNIKNTRTTGIKSDILNLNSNIKVYPNPASDVVNVVVEDLKTEAVITIENMLGQVVYIMQTNKPINSINTSNLNTGVYFVKVNTGREIKVERFIKE